MINFLIVAILVWFFIAFFALGIIRAAVDIGIWWSGAKRRPHRAILYRSGITTPKNNASRYTGK